MPERPSRQTLDLLPARALKLLEALGTHAEVRAALAPHGYTPAIHEEGWKLLDSACGRREVPTLSYDAADRREVEDAVAQVAKWEHERWLPVFHALRKKAPIAAETFPAPKERDAFGALVRVRRVLAAIDALEAKGAPADAASARKLLESRGLTAASRTEISTLIARGQKGVTAKCGGPATRSESLQKLYSWVDDWSIAAHVALKARRDLLIACGLVHRHRKTAKTKATAAAPAVVAKPS
jgi:hypothetical protein